MLQSVSASVCGSGFNVCDQKCEWASESGAICESGVTERATVGSRGDGGWLYDTEGTGSGAETESARAEVEVAWGEGAALAVSSEGLLEGSAGARLGPQDALSPRRGPGMHRHTMSSWGSEGTPIW